MVKPGRMESFPGHPSELRAYREDDSSCDRPRRATDDLFVLTRTYSFPRPSAPARSRLVGRDVTYPAPVEIGVTKNQTPSKLHTPDARRFTTCASIKSWYVQRSTWIRAEQPGRCSMQVRRPWSKSKHGGPTSLARVLPLPSARVWWPPRCFDHACARRAQAVNWHGAAVARPRRRRGRAVSGSLRHESLPRWSLVIFGFDPLRLSGDRY